jgi:hypothetical protein
LATPYARDVKHCYPKATRDKLPRGWRCWLPKYDRYIRELIPDDSPLLGDQVPPDIAEVCPKYATMSADNPTLRKIRRREFWGYLLQSMAAAESDFNLKAYHPPLREDLPLTASHGMLQISPSNCGLPESRVKALYTAKGNLSCSIRHLSRQLFQPDGSTLGLFSKATQWSVLRRTHNLGKVRACLDQRRIRGYTVGKDGMLDYSAVDARDQADAAGCAGLSGRKVLSQFWVGYEWGKPAGRNLCGDKKNGYAPLKNRLDFCGQLDCANPAGLRPEDPKTKHETRDDSKS